MSFPFQEAHGWMCDKVFIRKSTGKLVKVVMVSRFGDCGITSSLYADIGYTDRVMPSELDLIPGVLYDMTVAIPEDMLRSGYYSESEIETQLPLDVLSKMEDNLM